MAKLRLDLLLVDQGLAESRTKAQALIMAGLVYKGEQKLDKAGLELPEETELTVRGKEHPWVSRGGMKLAHGLAEFKIDVKGMVAMDVGSSTGGFTDVLLTNGAAKVYAVDVGTGQLDPKIRNDPRVVVMEQTNARHLTPEMVMQAQGQLYTPPASGGSKRGERVQFGLDSESTRQRAAMNHAKVLRKNPTDAEKKLWSYLRAGQLEGIKFRRQQSIGAYIVDFVSMEQQLVIELDGGQHAEQAGYDQKRTEFLQQAGYRVLRYWNNEVLSNIDGVIADVIHHLSESAMLPPPNLPPHAGGGILDIIVCDASFISLKKVLPAALALAKPGATLVTLIKPQFEVGKAEVSRGKGVIRDVALHEAVCEDIKRWVGEQGWLFRRLGTSPITGPKGNVEFLLWAVKSV